MLSIGIVTRAMLVYLWSAAVLTQLALNESVKVENVSFADVVQPLVQNRGELQLTAGTGFILSVL